MSDTNTTEIETLTETPATETAPAPKKERSSNRPSIKLAAVQAMASEMGLSETLGKDGAPPKSFVHYGHKGGVEVHVARNEDVTRVYIKKAHVQHDAVLNFDEEQRKTEGLGNVFGEIDFEKGADAALEALRLAFQAAKDAPAPVKVEAKPKAEKPAKKAKTAPEASSEPTAEASA